MHGALQCLGGIQDNGAIMDVLSVFLRGDSANGDDTSCLLLSQMLTLDDAVVILPLAARLADSEHELCAQTCTIPGKGNLSRPTHTHVWSSHVLMGLEVAQMVLHSFSDVINQSRLMKLHSTRDLAAAERVEKCSLCYEQLLAMRDRVQVLTQAGTSGICGIKAKLFLKAFSKLAG